MKPLTNKHNKSHRNLFKTKPITILAILFVLFFLANCNDQDELLLNSTILNGIWVEIEPNNVIQFTGTNHTFFFREDSFFLQREYWNDVVEPDDTCEGCPKFSYIKGKYILDLNTINLNGIFYKDSSFAVISDTVQPIIYNESFSYDLKTLDTLIFFREIEIRNIKLAKRK